MHVYQITLERISTGEQAPSMMVRKARDAARSYAQNAIRQSPEADDTRVVAVEARP